MIVLDSHGTQWRLTNNVVCQSTISTVYVNKYDNVLTSGACEYTYKRGRLRKKKVDCLKVYQSGLKTNPTFVFIDDYKLYNGQNKLFILNSKLNLLKQKQINSYERGN